MHKTLVLLGCLLAMFWPADAIGQAPASSLDTATHPANSFRANAIRNPDSIALVALGGWDGNLVCGLHGTPGQGFYTTFMDSMPLSRETDVARAIGAVDYDAQYKVFRFGPVAKLNGEDYRGTVCSFNAYEDLTTVSGRFDFPTHFQDKTISMALAGAWEENHRRKRVECDFVGGFDLGCIPKKAWEKLAKMALIATAMNPDLDWESEVFLHGLAELLDPDLEKPAKQMQALGIELDGHPSPYQIQTPAKIPASLLLSRLQFQYDEELGSFWSNGPVGVLAINGIPLNKLTTSNSKLEYVMANPLGTGAEASDTLRIYLEFDELDWVFFEFHGEVFRTISSDIDGYNAVLAASAAKKKGFRFQKISEEDKDKWLNDFVHRHIFRIGRGPMR